MSLSRTHFHLCLGQTWAPSRHTFLQLSIHQIWATEAVFPEASALRKPPLWVCKHTICIMVPLMPRPKEEIPSSPRCFCPLWSGLQELASISRHEQQVRQAIVGKSPGVHSQLLTRFIRSSRHLLALHFLISSGCPQLLQIALMGALDQTGFWWFVWS